MQKIFIKVFQMIDLHKGDCLEVMDRLIEQGVVVDAIMEEKL